MKPDRLVLRQRLEAHQAVFDGPQLATIEHHTHLRSRANGRGTWQMHAGPTAELRKLGWVFGMKLRAHVVDQPTWWWAVLITRVAEKNLDPFENLPMSMKPLVDGIASGLGVDDGNPRVRYVAHQERGAPLVRVELYLGGRL